MDKKKLSRYIIYEIGLVIRQILLSADDHIDDIFAEKNAD